MAGADRYYPGYIEKVNRLSKLKAAYASELKERKELLENVYNRDVRRMMVNYHYNTFQQLKTEWKKIPIKEQAGLSFPRFKRL